MKILAVFIGAIAGALIGAIALNLIGAEQCNGQDFDQAFFMLAFGIPALLVGALCGIALGLGVLRSLQREHLRPPERLRRHVILIGSAAVIAVLSWGMVVAADDKMGPPADQTFLEEFPYHEILLNQIVRMTQQDKDLVSLGPNFLNYVTASKSRIPSSRIAQYRQLLEEAQVPDGFLSSDAGDEVDFACYGNGSAISSDTNEGYAYLTKPPAHQVDNLDDYQFNEQDFDQKAFRHIRGRWYLYREYLPG